MIRLSLLTAGLLVFGGILGAQTETEIRVYRADLATGAPISGKLVLLPGTLAFIDDNRPESSFAVARSAIRSVNNERETVTLQLNHAIRDRSGQATRVILRLQTASDGASVQRWYQDGESAAAASPPADTSSISGGQPLTFSAQRQKRFRGNTNGTLIIDQERVIFESTERASESRRWDLKEISEFKLNNPYEVEIRTFRGEKYALSLSGRGMDNSQHREIVGRITEARTAR
jgi:hypothetical protein